MSDHTHSDTSNLADLGAPETAPAIQAPFKEDHAFRDRIFALVGALGVTGLVVLVSVTSWFDHETAAAPQELSATIAEAVLQKEESDPVGPNPYESLALEAQAVIVYDIARDTVLFSSNEDTEHPLASLTKLMTGLVASEALKDKDRVVVRESAIETEGDSGLFANESWSWRDLLSFTLMTSSNDGADALATVAGATWIQAPKEDVHDYEKVDAFVAQMNERARDLGLTHTSFSNATGLDVGPNREGARGTARDVSRLIAYIWEHEPAVLDYTTEATAEFRSLDGYRHSATNTNEYVTQIPGILGSKTGYTDLAGGNLAIVYDSGLDHPIAVVVLGSSRDGRFSDVQTLVDATYTYMTSGWYDFEIAGTTPRS